MEHDAAAVADLPLHVLESIISLLFHEAPRGTAALTCAAAVGPVRQACRKFRDTVDGLISELTFVQRHGACDSGPSKQQPSRPVKSDKRLSKQRMPRIEAAKRLERANEVREAMLRISSRAPMLSSVVVEVGRGVGPAVADLLSAGPSRLRSVELAFNCIGDSGAKVLAEALKGNATLRRLGLRRNAIGDVGAEASSEPLASGSLMHHQALSISFPQLLRRLQPPSRRTTPSHTWP